MSLKGLIWTLSLLTTSLSFPLSMHEDFRHRPYTYWGSRSDVNAMRRVVVLGGGGCSGGGGVVRQRQRSGFNMSSPTWRDGEIQELLSATGEKEMRSHLTEDGGGKTV